MIRKIIDIIGGLAMLAAAAGMLMTGDNSSAWGAIACALIILRTNPERGGGR